MNEAAQNETILAMATEIVAAYVGNNSVAAADLPRIIADVVNSLAGKSGAATANAPAAPVASGKPAVKVADSVTAAALICLDCGQSFKTLKRHLGSEHNLSPDEYRAKWNLPADYPIVAANYTKKRSRLAKQIGLGRTGKKRRRG